MSVNMPVPTMAMGFSQPNIKSRRNRMKIAFSKSLPTKVQAATLAMLKTLCPWRRCDVIWGFSNFERDPSIYWYTWKLYTNRFLVQLETYYIYNFYLYSYDWWTWTSSYISCADCHNMSLMFTNMVRFWSCMLDMAKVPSHCPLLSAQKTSEMIMLVLRCLHKFQLSQFVVFNTTHDSYSKKERIFFSNNLCIWLNDNVF